MQAWKLARDSNADGAIIQFLEQVWPGNFCVACNKQLKHYACGKITKTSKTAKNLGYDQWTGASVHTIYCDNEWIRQNLNGDERVSIALSPVTRSWAGFEIKELDYVGNADEHERLRQM